MNFEDLYQRAAHIDDDVFSIWYIIYHWLPRTGEIYQRTAIHFMTPQLSLGFDIIFRLLTAAMASGLVFLLTVFVLGRRPRLKIKDALIYLGIFISLLVLGAGEIFTFNFSYAHNYVICALLLVAFSLPYRLKLTKTKLPGLVGVFILGILVGMSSEVVPIALIIIIGALAIFKLKTGSSWRVLWKTYRLQCIGVFGLICGLILYYAGANVGMRVNGGYGEIYDYVSPFGVFKAPVYTIMKIVQHLFYNIRYLHFAVLLMFLIILLEYSKYRHQQSNHLSIQVCCLAFCILYVGAASLLAVHDDMYYRFMSPVYVTVYASVWLCTSDYINAPEVFTERALRNIYIIFIAIGTLMICDLSYAMIRYNLIVKPHVQEIIVDEEGSPIFDQPSINGEYDMYPSPIFRIEQSSPFHWPRPD